MSLEQEGNDIRIHNCWGCGIHSECDGPGAFSAKRPDQGHEFIRAFRVVPRIGLQVLDADRRFEDYARRESYLILFCFRLIGPL